MARRFKPGQAVVCVKTRETKYNFLVGSVGMVHQVIDHDPILRFLGCTEEYIVDFPLFRSVPCPCCGETHDGMYMMHDNELEPLDDPDGEQAVTDEETPFTKERS